MQGWGMVTGQVCLARYFSGSSIVIHERRLCFASIPALWNSMLPLRMLPDGGGWVVSQIINYMLRTNPLKQSI